MILELRVCRVADLVRRSHDKANEVPLILNPMVFLYGYGIAFIGFIYCLVVHSTRKIVLIGRERFEQRLNDVFCFLHSFIWLYFVVFLRHRLHAWMQHPTWFLKPSHVLLLYLGLRKIVFGSTGHSGKEAAHQLVEYLRKGYEMKTFFKMGISRIELLCNGCLWGRVL